MLGSNSSMYDCVIVGGGISGLSAAIYLKDCNVNNICVLEARDRVGGRTCTEYATLDNGKTCYYDAGGAYVGPMQNRIVRLAQRYNIGTFHVNMKGKTTLHYNGRVSAYEGVIPNTGVLSLLDLNHLMREMNRLSKLIDCSNIWNSKLTKQQSFVSLCDTCVMLPLSETFEEVSGILWNFLEISRKLCFLVFKYQFCFSFFSFFLF